MTKDADIKQKEEMDAREGLFRLLKKSVQNLNPYQVDPTHPKVKLDANENNWLAGQFQPALKNLLDALPLHQYPDSECTALRRQLAVMNGVSAEQVITGVGSDQIIAWLIQAFVETGDRVLVMDPTFAMYEINTLMAGGQPVRVPLGEGFVFQAAPFLAKAREVKPKVVFLTNPNNPTGGVIPTAELTALIKDLSGEDCIIALDEAYYEFYGETALPLIETHDQLIVLRTLSKAYGLAGVRAGYALASRPMMAALARVKPPYHMSGLDQLAALVCLDQAEELKPILQRVVEWRNKMAEALQEMAAGVAGDDDRHLTIYPSKANFLLIRTPLAGRLDERLREAGILVRGYGVAGPLANCLRITIGTEAENQEVLSVFHEVFAP